MAQKVRVRLKLRGINELMTGRGATAAVVSRAQAIQRAAGPDFEVNVVPHRYTARAFIRPAKAEGAKREARDKVLTRALNAGRD